MLCFWEFLSDFDRSWVYECMDLVKLSVDGNSKNRKWLIYDASFDYEVGIFDGKSMITNKSKYLGDLGKNYYAAQTFNNSPDGRSTFTKTCIETLKNRKINPPYFLGGSNLIGPFRKHVVIDQPTLINDCLLYTSDAADE